MRDPKDPKPNRQNSQPQSKRTTNDRKRRFDTLVGSDADEPQICRGID